MLRIFLIHFFLLGLLPFLRSQITESEVKCFINEAYGVRYSKLSDAEVDSILKASSVYTLGIDSVSKETASNLYVLRGQLMVELVQRKIKVKAPYSSQEISSIEETFKKSQQLDSLNKCYCVESLQELYKEDAFFSDDHRNPRLAELEQIYDYDCGWDTHLSFGLNYMVPANILGGSFCFVGSDKVFNEPRRADDFNYPTGAGVFGFGFEGSLTQNYYAYKTDLVWLSFLLNIRPAQFLYAKKGTASSFMWRPEIGYGFSSLSLNYAYNLPFKKSFNYIPAHNISLTIIIKAWNITK